MLGKGIPHDLGCLDQTSLLQPMWKYLTWKETKVPVKLVKMILPHQRESLTGSPSLDDAVDPLPCQPPSHLHSNSGWAASARTLQRQSQKLQTW